MSGIWRGFGLVVAGFALFGCGAFEFSGARANDRVNPEKPLWFARPNGALSVVVRRELSIESKELGERYQHGKPAIDGRSHRVFIGAADHGLYALRAGDGETLWRFETLGAVQSEPIYDEELDIVFFGSHDGAFYAVRAFDGSLVFRFDTGAEVGKAAVRRGETLYVANAADTLFALDRRSGKEKWRARRNPALGMEIAGYSGPTVAGDLVVIGFSDGNVSAYDAQTGQERWSPVDLAVDGENAEGESPKYLDVDTTPALATHSQGPVVLVAAYATGVYALDAQTGARVWWNDQMTGVTDLMVYREGVHAAPGPVVAAGDTPLPASYTVPQLPARQIVIVSSASTGLAGLDAETGRTLWRNKVPEGGITAPVQCEGAIVVGTSRYGLFLISPLNGLVIDGMDLGPGFSVTPSVLGARVFTMTNQGTFLGLHVLTPSWRSGGAAGEYRTLGGSNNLAHW